jgi:hypothetical protein
MPSKKHRVLAKKKHLTPVNQAQSHVEFFKAENARLRKENRLLRKLLALLK